MTNRYVDTNVGGGANNGSSTDDAWQSIETAMEWNGFAPGDKTWIKRDSLYTCAGDAQDIAPADDGTAKEPLYFIGWPRAVILNTTITQADFTNGSNIIDNVVGITPDREKHIGRFITGPDGFQYMITAVLWEADVDGMAGGAEFTIGSKATNTTQTKIGKIWGFTDDLDNTGTIQYVRDQVSAWVNNDNITDADGGDAEIEVGGETAVGFLIDREYAGSTVTTTNGKFQIEADEDYTEAQAIDDSGFTIKLSTWDDDADDLPLVDFNGKNSQLLLSQVQYYYFANLDFRNSIDANGMVYFNTMSGDGFIGCLFRNSNNSEIIRSSDGALTFKRIIIEGTGAGSAQHGFELHQTTGSIIDTAIYNMGGNGYLSSGSMIYLENVNLGLEIGNLSTDLNFYRKGGTTHGRGVNFGAESAETTYDVSSMIPWGGIKIENYNKVLGAHKTFNVQGAIIKLAVVAGSGDPYKRAGGADNVINIEYDKNTTLVTNPVFNAIEPFPVFTHEFEATTDSKSYRYYVQCEGIVTVDELFIIVEYVDSYDDASEYTMTTQQSDEAFTARANAEDWAEYMEVTGIQPAIGSKVRIKCYCSFYHATQNIYIDPMVVIS
ncbi:hypothetical protein LCGC14_1830600 [marine sediment metagenome]|uniref:Uncharacterized protein n=1 Tax=marine sediment metagenome TaxID=412755 RepID=A0A0F9GG92_9ZZZZ